MTAEVSQAPPSSTPHEAPAPADLKNAPTSIPQETAGEKPGEAGRSIFRKFSISLGARKNSTKSLEAFEEKIESLVNSVSASSPPLPPPATAAVAPPPPSLPNQPGPDALSEHQKLQVKKPTKNQKAVSVSKLRRIASAIKPPLVEIFRYLEAHAGRFEKKRTEQNRKERFTPFTVEITRKKTSFVQQSFDMIA